MNSKPVVPPSTSKIPVQLLAANGVGRRGKTDVEDRGKDRERERDGEDEKDEQSVASGGSTSWAAKKGAKKNTASKSQSQSQSDNTRTSHSDDGSDDDPKLSTGSFKTDIATKGGPSFNVDDWQPDFNGSQSTASVATSLKRENTYCILFYCIVLYCIVLSCILLYCSEIY